MNPRCLLGHRGCKPDDQIGPGDVVMFLGNPHLIAQIEPYTHPTLGEMTGIARAADGWGITLDGGCMEVAAL